MLIPPTRCDLNTDRYLGFRVQIAEFFDPDRHNPVGMWVSRKLNGIRCLAHCRVGKAPLIYTKKGFQITGLDALHDDLARVAREFRIDVVLDGELCLATPDGSDDFNKLVSVIQRRNHTIENPRLHVFDVVTPPQFVSGRSPVKFSDRLFTLNLGIEESHGLKLVRNRQIASMDDFHSEIARAAQNGWEGLILRNDVPYAGQISDNILKVREWRDCELPIVGYRLSSNRVAVLQVQFHGRSLDLDATTLPPEQLEPFHTSPARLLSSVVTVQWQDNTLASPKAVTLWDGGRKV